MPADRPVVVLGGGINGAAIARELALSGAGVVVVDEADVAGGATAWSTRLIHGGLRYLEYGELALVRESLAERARLVRLAPHLVRPLGFFLPVRRRTGGLLAAAARLAGWESLARRLSGPGGRGLWAVNVGLWLYDRLAADGDWPRHSLVRAGAAGVPRVDAGLFPFGGFYTDAQLTYPERFTVELLVDAARIAAAAGTRLEVLTHRTVRPAAGGGLLVSRGPGAADDPSAPPRSDAACELSPAAIVNATGAWVDRTLAAVMPAAGGPAPLIGGTKGSHLVVRSAALRGALADRGVYAEAADGRPVFVLPFAARLVLVGTTDIPFSGDPATARADEQEIDYLLAATRRLFPAVPLARADVQQHYCGVRPLPAAGAAGAARSPAGITRRHLLVRHPGAGVPTWSIVGGKLTTCRSLAESVAREVLPAIGLAVRETSRDRPLPGGVAGASRDRALETAAAAGRTAGATAAAAPRAAAALVELFGGMAAEVWRAAADPADASFLAGTDLPAAVVAHCVRAEWGATVADLIERRLMLAFDERLTRDTVVDVARALARAGRLAAADVDRAADDWIAAFEHRHGRRVGAAAAPAAAAPPAPGS
jgi:glycerol-3-phosphate dehydrogenase